MGHPLTSCSGSSRIPPRREPEVEKRIEQILYWGIAVVVAGFMLTGVYFLWVKPLLD